MNKLYVIIRKDLSYSQQAVQGGHAVAEYLINDPLWQNTTLIYLGVKNLKQMINLKRKLDMYNIKYTEWKEPDINNETTAIASDIDSPVFRKLNLL